MESGGVLRVCIGRVATLRASTELCVICQRTSTATSEKYHRLREESLLDNNKRERVTALLLLLLLRDLRVA